MQFFDPRKQASFSFDERWILAGQLEPRNFNHEFFAFGQEFVQRRVQQTNRDRKALHFFVKTNEVLLLERKQLIQITLPVFARTSQDHLLHDGDTILGEEHMLGAAQADALRAEASGDPRLVRDVGIGPHPQSSNLVRP